MPRVKFDYVVSFSSEDADNPASNLLAWEVNKKKWLCNKGEPNCSVVLQLAKAVKINAVHIGAHHAALVEVLVGRSEKPNEPFQVLVPSSVFLSPGESRRDEPPERVRSFTAEQLSAEARDQRWDRLRVLCSQPYNKHCKYGLSFIHIYEPEGKDTASEPTQAAAPAVPTRLLTLDTFSSDEDDFKPGELFAKHQKDSQESGSSTDAQIRQASSQALKNISDTATKLVKTPIAKTKRYSQDVETGHSESDARKGRDRESLMYTDDDDKPHEKIDRVVNKYKDERSKEQTKTSIDADSKKDKDAKHNRDDKNRNDRSRNKDDSFRNKGDSSRSKDDTSRSRDNASRSRDDNSRSRDDFNIIKTPHSSKKDSSSINNDRDKNSRKRIHSDDKHDKNKLRPGPISDSPHTLLRGVVFVLSGYQNPRRGALRDQALAMGARFERDWGPTCTHLICAFSNTPKQKAVRASSNGSKAVVVTGEWIEQCCQRRRLLPWQWFATEPKQRVTPTDIDDEEEKQAADSEVDTDDEIEKAIRKQKKRRTDSPKPNKDRKQEDSANVSSVSRDSDVAFVRDERMQGNVTVEDSSDGSDTEAETSAAPKEWMDEASSLPDFFEGRTFIIQPSIDFDADLLRRYVCAYGGVVVEESHLDEGSKVDYYLCDRAVKSAPGPSVRADWVWRCHQDKILYPHAEYAFTT